LPSFDVGNAKAALREAERRCVVVLFMLSCLTKIYFVPARRD